MKVELDKFLPFRRSGSKADLALNSLRFEGIEQTWDQIPGLFRALVAPLPPRWEEIFGPLRVGKIDDLMVAGQIGQSLDVGWQPLPAALITSIAPPRSNIFIAYEPWLMPSSLGSRLHVETIRN
jgi:hypothetical protein